ncbi:Hypothetical protein DEACI_2881 [Acididesulfobacillus acetoxydans]|uniref:Uncharacterized protein n=1 Tax=Acididesulfobacillus acetoxydans TaxID=1561005 RepID=A0A8S0W430_9FIRM|nr:Hypothetical protein DEACI_2881 [Acididesulfobacillus acetoxydans]CEJ07574.1 Hypothetical protein DEACI_2040 [Acididesulfobacillus acetoxydans]
MLLPHNLVRRNMFLAQGNMFMGKIRGKTCSGVRPSVWMENVG